MPSIPLDDEQIERYSRQIVLAEIGPLGQAKLAAARVAIAASGAAAERAAAYLAAAGVGTLALAPSMQDLVDPAQPDVTLESLTDEPGVVFDAALVAAGQDTPHAARSFWVSDGRLAEEPPCSACAVAALGPAAPIAAVLAPLRDALLGTIVATEIVKALLGLGVGLRGRVLSYDPQSATFATTQVGGRPDCACSTRPTG